MKEVVAYGRVACAKESDPGAEVQRQEQMVRRYADARGLIICETYLDAGVSGGTLERPALQSLLADCRAGRIDTVITQDLERLSRSLGGASALDWTGDSVWTCSRTTNDLEVSKASATMTTGAVN